MSYDLHPALNLYISVNMTFIRIVYTTPSYNNQLKMAYVLKETMVLKCTAKIYIKKHKNVPRLNFTVHNQARVDICLCV